MFKFENFNTPATNKSEDFQAIGGKNNRPENYERGSVSVNEALDMVDEDQLFESQVHELDRENSDDEDLDLNELLGEPTEATHSLQEALQAEIQQLEKETSKLEVVAQSDTAEADESTAPEHPEIEKSQDMSELSEVEAQQRDIEVLEQQLESQPESMIEELKTQIDEINTRVQTSQPSTKQISVDEQVAALEQQIYAIESKNAAGQTEESVVPTLSDEVAELEPDEAPEKSPEMSQWRQLKVEFKQAEKEYYEALSENATVGAKWFGLGRAEMNPQVKAAYDKFMDANTDFYKSAQENGVYDRVARFASRKSTAEQAELSAGTLVAERHIFKPAEERLERQTASLAMPEGIRNLKGRITGLIKNHKVAAGLTGGIALTAAAAFAAPALATMAAGATVGFATKYASKKLLTKRFVAGSEKGLEDKSSAIVDLMSQKNLHDLEALENELFAAKNFLQQRKTAVNNISRAAGIGGAMAAGGFTADALADDVMVSATEGGGVNMGPSRSYTESVEYSDPRDWGQDLSNQTPDYSEVHLNNEVLPNAVEKVETIHTIAGGENLSSVLLSHLNNLVDNGFMLPEGVGQDDVARYMYESFPELTNAPDAVARLTPEQWMEVGISSGDPDVVSAGETINMNALAEKMLEAPVEMTPGPTPPGMQESVVSGSNPVESSDITWWGDQSDMQMTDEATVENNAGIQPQVSDATGQEAGVPAESAGLESAEAAAVLEVGYTAGDFDNLLETIGSSHDFKDGPTMWNHLLGIMDEMSFENKQKYFEGLVVDDALGVPVEQAHYSWLEQNMSEAAPPWMDTSGPDRLTPEQWEYAGVPSGDPRDLTGAVLDHSKLFDVLFNKEFDVSEALNESSDAIGSEVSGTSPEITAAEPVISEPVDTLETAEAELSGIDTSAQGIDEIRSQLQAIKEKFANPGPDGTVSTNARELAIRAWDGGEFTLDTAPTTTGDGANDGMLNSFRKSIAEGSSGGQEFFGSTLKKEIWVQPDGSVQEIHFKPGGGVSFAGY